MIVISSPMMPTAQLLLVWAAAHTRRRAWASRRLPGDALQVRLHGRLAPDGDAKGEALAALRASAATSGLRSLMP
jgi:hypothetical protein